MKTIANRALAMLLVLAMVMSLGSTSALAAQVVSGQNGKTIYISTKTQATPTANGLTVTAADTVKSIAVTKQPDKLVYTSGDKLDLTGMVEATYESGATEVVTGYMLLMMSIPWLATVKLTGT